MKAIESLPIGPSESKAEGQTASADKRPNRVDTYFARIRKLEQRVLSLESALSTCRRDLNRVDRRSYRETPGSRAQPRELNIQEETVNPWDWIKSGGRNG